jgi:CubicO group peptidase (beta-lactamase class C family)
MSGLLLAGTGVLLGAAAPPPGPTEATLRQCFDLQAQKTPFSGVVAASDGKARFERVAGFVDAAGTKPPSTDVPFRLASVQKVLTGVAIGRLVDQGRISLDAPVGKYLGGLPADLAQVTIDQLLHHQSGVASMTMLNPQIAQALMAAKSALDLVPLVASQPLAFPPGSKTEYSNGGYYLLGAVIEAVSGMSYGDFLQAQLFGPLHMTSSSTSQRPDVATPYTRMMAGGGPGDAPRPMSGGPLFPATAAGDGVSSASDMLALGRALVGDQVIAKATKERIFQHKSDPWRIGQSGGAPGANTDFAVFPDTGWVTIVLSNYDPPAGELMGEVIRKVASGGACQPLAPEDRPSPFRMILRPPPEAVHG